MSKTKVVSLRMTIDDLAKGRDTLISIGIPESDITTLSEIIKTCFYYGLVAKNPNIKSPASKESIFFVKQKCNQTKLTKNISLIKNEE